MPAATPSRAGLKVRLRTILLFLAGFAIGALAFMPWEALWERGLHAASARLAPATLAWDAVESAGPFSARLVRVRLSTPAGQLHAPSATLGLGLGAELTAQVDTGPILTLSLDRSGGLSLQGGVEVSKLGLGWTLAGRMDLDGRLEFKALGSPPSGGSISAKSAKLTRGQEPALEGLDLTGRLNGNHLAIERLTLAKPTPTQASGNVDLRWSSLTTSRVRLNGFTGAGEAKTPLTVSTTLAGLIEDTPPSPRAASGPAFPSRPAQAAPEPSPEPKPAKVQPPASGAPNRQAASPPESADRAANPNHAPNNPWGL